MNTENRRKVLKKMALSGLALGSTGLGFSLAETNIDRQLKGNVRHAVSYWTYSYLGLEGLCQTIKKIGFNAIDLLGPKDWPTIKAHGVECSMCNGAEISLTQGFNDPNNHAQLIKNYSELIPLVAEAGYTNLICFSGNRNGMDDETGLNNCMEGLKKIIHLAEKHGVILHMELLNSKIDHKDYMCDRSAWGVELCKRVDSENFKLLYDIYHMQIDEGDLIRTIRENHTYFGHYHTAGNPGRGEIDDSQEINYPAVIKAIVETGFKGFVAQEFAPKASDKIASLEQAIRICDV
ncbi:hydroxypyruvate isomerase family protein [Mongoliitalea daihaiensis]|uniref:hydroxypyruvate isomerase family protein n=1 Tax=Mongoliitalea daihaiensis TaxID=2782006 RepID=UPI001F1DBB92|nr:TIM barrel protein [Mongoliitalea daihaiensis]UJP65236.1 TIM barrel protein [Mongoliitalea daihaiensis]